MTPQSDDDRSPARAFPRAEVNLVVVRRSRSDIYEDFARVLGAGGMFVENEDPPPVGSEVSMEFGLPGLEAPVEICAEVVWRREPGGEQPPGMGLHFTDVAETLRRRIADFVEQQRIASPGDPTLPTAS